MFGKKAIAPLLFAMLVIVVLAIIIGILLAQTL